MPNDIFVRARGCSSDVDGAIDVYSREIGIGFERSARTKDNGNAKRQSVRHPSGHWIEEQANLDAMKHYVLTKGTAFSGDMIDSIIELIRKASPHHGIYRVMYAESAIGQKLLDDHIDIGVDLGEHPVYGFRLYAQGWSMSKLSGNGRAAAQLGMGRVLDFSDCNATILASIYGNDFPVLEHRVNNRASIYDDMTTHYRVNKDAAKTIWNAMSFGQQVSSWRTSCGVANDVPDLEIVTRYEIAMTAIAE